MAVINRNSRVLNNVSVVRDVVTGTMGNGVHAASHQAPAMPFSKRRQSQWFPQPVQEPAQRGYRADSGVDSPAPRAGRSGSRPRVLASRTGHQTAELGRTGSCLGTALRSSRLAAWQSAISDSRSQRCSFASHSAAHSHDISAGMLAARASKRMANSARFNPAGAAPLASTRG
jgi:hypothetical protein